MLYRLFPVLSISPPWERGIVLFTDKEPEAHQGEMICRGPPAVSGRTGICTQSPFPSLRMSLLRTQSQTLALWSGEEGGGLRGRIT